MREVGRQRIEPGTLGVSASDVSAGIEARTPAAVPRTSRRRSLLARARLVPRRSKPLPVRSLVTLLGGIIALVTALSIPIGYGIIGHLKAADTLTYKAELTAARAAQYIYAVETPWTYDTDQLTAIGELLTPTAVPMVQRIVDSQGATMLQKGKALPWPTFARGAPILASGAMVGTAEVSASMRPLLTEVGLVALGALVLAVAAYFAFAVLPLGVIDRTLSELRAANDKLGRQNLLLDTALENMGQGLAMFDANLRVVIANDRYARLYGLDPEQTRPGTTLREIVELRMGKGLFAGLKVDDVYRVMQERLERKVVSHITNKLPDGRIVAATVQPRADGGWVVTHQDISERETLNARLARQNALLKEREEQLNAQNERFNAATNNMSQGLCLFDAQQSVVFANRPLAELYGMAPEDVQPGTPLRQILAARVAKGVYSNIDAAKFVEDGVASFNQQVSQIVHLADGRFISVLRRPMRDGSLVSTHEDVTEREKLYARLAAQNDLSRRQEEELKSQNERFDAALRNMSQGICMFDAEQRVLIANERYAEMYGLTPEQVKPGTTLRQIIEHRIAKGLYAGSTPASYIKERLARFNSASVAVHHMSDGRAICVRRQPMRGGGWVTTHENVTERETLQMQLAQQNAQLDAAMNNMSQGLAMFDDEQRLVICNRHYAEMYRLTPDQIRPGTTAREIVQHRFANGCYPAADPQRRVDAFVARTWNMTSEVHELADGRIISISYRKTANGGHVFTHQDITERERLNARLEQQHLLLKQQEEKLRQQNVQLDAALNNMVQGLAMFDGEQRVVVANSRYAEIYGLTPEQVAPGTTVRQILEYRIANGWCPGKSADEMLDTFVARSAGKTYSHHTTTLIDSRCIAVSLQKMADGGTVTTHQDITEQRRSEAKIVHMALHDALTDLPNRVLLNERLEHALTRVKRGEIVAVHLLDLDHFKTVNDTLGHPTGDKLLKMVTARLHELVRETDTIARMGGDEFAVLQVAIFQPADATALALRIIEAVSAPYTVDGQQVIIGTSVGIAVGPADGMSPDQLIRNADLALYRAKGDGRGTYRFFGPEMDAQMQTRRVLEYDLRKALPAGEFELHYQPVVNLENNQISGVEALIRWRHPEKGLIPPSAFIPVAEEIGFIIPLGEWAIRQACMTAKDWPGDVRIAVNLSPIQFRTPGFVQLVVSALAASGLAADRLELEITESTLLQDSEATLSTLFQLRALGVRIAMDDFGTGYSSLSYLQSFPFDKIKIDRSFVKDIADGVGSLNIVRAVAALANGLGMATTAEGVETNEQRETVKAEGCTEMQGFLFSRPVSAHEIGLLLAESRPKGVEGRPADYAA